MEVFQKLFETGIEVQKQNGKAMQDTFDFFWSSDGKAGLKGVVTADTIGANSCAEESKSAPARTAKSESARSAAARTPNSQPGSNGKAG